MSESESKSVTDLLVASQAGRDVALQTALPLVYKELRRIAHRYLRNERSGHTLQSTALVHEAYLRLQKQENMKFQNRAHFFAICAQMMRQILVDYARKRNAVKRDAGLRLTLDDSFTPIRSRSVDFEALNDALQRLTEIDPRQGRIVELRFFGGLSIEETAKELHISVATVKRDWATARVWLHREMSKTAIYDS